jgi:hypothetical protein
MSKNPKLSFTSSDKPNYDNFGPCAITDNSGCGDGWKLPFLVLTWMQDVRMKVHAVG